MNTDPKTTVEFGSMAAGLLFLKRSLPRASSEAWQIMQCAAATSQGHHGPFSLALPETLFAEAQAKRALEVCGGTINEPVKNRRTPTTTLPLAELFRHVALTPTGLTERARRFLVMPRVGRYEPTRLIGAMAGLHDWKTTFHETADSQRQYFLLESHNGLSAPLPTGLPGAPIILAEMADEVFVPPGLAHPFLPDHRFMLPPAEPGQRHAWTINANGAHEHVVLQERPNQGEPLARRVTLKQVKSTGEIATASTTTVEVALELQEFRGSNGEHRDAGSAVYRIETRAGEFGPLLLRFLDHAEAGIEKFTYYIRPRGEGPNAPVEHYLLTDERINDEQSWPELARFYCPRILEDLNLPIFVPANRRFAPDIEGLLRAADADEPLLVQLAEATGFPPGGPVRTSDGQQQIAIILPESNPQAWSVLHLENGRPLAEAIRATSTAYNREAVRRVLRSDPPSLVEERKNYEERWIAAGTAEATEIAALTHHQAQEMAQAAAGIDRDLAELEHRIGDAQEILEAAGAMAAEQLPRTVHEYANQTSKLFADLAEPQRAWLGQMAEGGSRLEQLRQATTTLQRQATEEVCQLNAENEAREREIALAGQQLATRMAALETGVNQLAGAVNRAEAAAQEASTAMQRRQATLDHRRASSESREREILQEDARLNTVQAEVERQEAEITERRRRLDLRRQGLERRAQQAQRAVQAAAQEEVRLNQLEEVAIPEMENRRAEAEARVVELRRRGIDAALEAATAEFKAVEAMRAELENKAAVLDARRAALEKTKARRTTLERDIERKITALESDESTEKEFGEGTDQYLVRFNRATEALAEARDNMRAAQSFFAGAKAEDRERTATAIDGVNSQLTALESTARNAEAENALIRKNAANYPPPVPRPVPPPSKLGPKTSWFRRIFRR